jgi:O-antigen/teichoic acid export membrane protein
LQTIAYPLFAFVALLAGASFVPFILGRGYSEVTEALRWLSLLPLLKTLHYFVADSLTGAGFQRLRTIIQVGIAAFNFTINLWLIPSFGWRGAAWASIASDGLLAAGLWCAATVLILRQSRALQATEGLV